MPDSSKKLQGLSIHWFTSDRFDTKPDKSSWTEVGDALAQQGANVRIITSYADKPYFPENKQVQMVYLKTLDLPLIYRAAFTFSSFFWLLKFATRNDLIILNQHELWMLPLLKLTRFNNVHLDIRTLPVVGDSLKDKLDIILFWKIAMRLFAKSCKSYSFITQRLLEAVENEFSTTYDDYTIWQSGVNTSFFSDVLSTVETPKQIQPYTIFYHGSLYKRRGIDRVVEAFARLPEAILNQSRFVIVGSGSGLEPLRKQVAEFALGNKVELRGLVPYEQIPLQISQADVCICPLPDYPEWNVSSPLKVLEYMACAKPMILTPIAAHTDVLGKESFVVWTQGDDIDNFVAAITHAYECSGELKEAARSAPALVRQMWDWKTHGERFGDYLSTRYMSESPEKSKH